MTWMNGFLYKLFGQLEEVTKKFGSTLALVRRLPLRTSIGLKTVFDI